MTMLEAWSTGELGGVKVDVLEQVEMKLQHFWVESHHCGHIRLVPVWNEQLKTAETDLRLELELAEWDLL